MIRKLDVGPQWTVESDEQSIGVYNIKATDGMGKEFLFIGYENEDLAAKMTAAINAYDAAKHSAKPDPTKDSPMPRITLYTGALLIFLGICFYVLTGSIHPTALIPCWFGLALAICGSLAGNGGPAKLKLFMHIAVTVGLLGFLGGAIMAIVELVKSGGFPLLHPHAVEEQVLMALICQIFVVLCIRSFIAARRARASETAV